MVNGSRRSRGGNDMPAGLPGNNPPLTPPGQPNVKIVTSPNTPFVSNVEKEIQQKRAPYRPINPLQQPDMPKTSLGEGPSGLQEQKQFSEPTQLKTGTPGMPGAPVVKFEMYQQQPVKKRTDYDELPKVMYPVNILGNEVKIPIPIQQNVYKINLPGPTGDHVQMNHVFETMLPGKEGRFTSSTLGERIQMYDYIRQILIQVNDGEDISLESAGQGQRSLMSYIKFMEINPNYYSPINHSPYKGLPHKMLIYRSCFPIRVDPITNNVACSRDSLGMNIRVYGLTISEHYSYYFRHSFYKEYDVWRELAYYEYIREYILKKKQCPNFVMLYAFFVSTNKSINFITLKKNIQSQRNVLTNETRKIERAHEMLSKEPVEKMDDLSIKVSNFSHITRLPDEIDPKLQAYSGRSLIMVTEAPDNNMYQWASKKYEREGAVSKMLAHGFYDDKVWMSILFQLMVGLYTMQLHGLYILNMSIEDNVYIKDLKNTTGKSMGYWKYIINGIPFYVPNYGYLVLIDTNFKDIIYPSQTIAPPKRLYKIYANGIYGKIYDEDSIRANIFTNYKNIINTNNFTKEHTRNNVTRPPSSIMFLIDQIMADQERNIGNVIIKYFGKLMHNRIGTIATETESNAFKDPGGEYKKGDMVGEILEEKKFKWCVVKEVTEDGDVSVITRNNSDTNQFIVKTLRRDVLYKYTMDKVDQTFNSDVSFADEDLLETYQVN